MPVHRTRRSSQLLRRGLIGPVALLFAIGPPACSQTIRTLLGPGDQGGLFGSQIVLSNPGAMALDRDGNLYVAEVYPPRVVRIGADGHFTSVAGTGVPGGGGDGGPALQAQFREPVALALDGQGQLYVADDADGRVRRIDRSGTISTFAGPGAPNRGGAAVSQGGASLVQPASLAFDPAGNLLVADSGADQIFRVSSAGALAVVAGQAGKAGFGGDEGPATAALLNHPDGVSVGPDNSIFIADGDNGRVRKITPDGVIHTIAGGGGVDQPAGQATALRLDSPNRVFVTTSGALWITQATTNRLRVVSPSGMMTTLAGNGMAGFAGDDSTPPQSPLNYPFAAAGDASGTLFFTDTGNNRVRVIARDGSFASYAGGPGASGLSLSQSVVVGPSGGASDSRGNLYIADSGHHRILRVSPAGVVDVFAGRGAPGFFGDGGPAALAGFGSSDARATVFGGVAVDAHDNVYVADTLNFRIRRIAPDGTIATVAGTGAIGFSGDNGPATAAQVSEVRKLGVDGHGNLYFVDRGNRRVRKVDAQGTITTVAGDGTAVYAGDGDRATRTGLPGPDGLYVTPDGTLYITDIDQPRLYRVDPAGTIITVAGTGARGSSGDGAKAAGALLDFPEAVVGDAAGNLYVAERYLDSIRRIDRAGTITTIAGDGKAESTGDGGPAAQAGLWRPVDLAITPNGHLLICEQGNSHRVRIIAGLP